MTMKATELRVDWYKSSYSNDQGGNCIECGDLPGQTAVRDSKVPDGPAFLVSNGAWAKFVGAIKADEITV